jgi:hypothetical protein
MSRLAITTLHHAATGAAVVLSAACSTWRVQPVGPEQLIAERRPAEVRLSRADGSRLVLYRPIVRNDSVVGQAARDSAGVPVSDVSAVAVRRGDALKTVGLVVLVTGAAAAIACAAGGCDYGIGGFSAGQP